MRITYLVQQPKALAEPGKWETLQPLLDEPRIQGNVSDLRSQVLSFDLPDGGELDRLSRRRSLGKKVFLFVGHFWLSCECRIVFVVLSGFGISQGLYHQRNDLTASSLDAWIKALYGFEKAEVSTPLRSWKGLLARWAGIVILNWFEWFWVWNLRRSPFERGPTPFEENGEAKPDITNVDGWIRSACTRDEKRIGRMWTVNGPYRIENYGSRGGVDFCMTEYRRKSRGWVLYQTAYFIQTMNSFWLSSLRSRQGIIFLHVILRITSWGWCWGLMLGGNVLCPIISPLTFYSTFTDGASHQMAEEEQASCGRDARSLPTLHCRSVACMKPVWW